MNKLLLNQDNHQLPSIMQTTKDSLFLEDGPMSG